MLTAVIADDLTGSADTGVQFARAGYRTAVVFRGGSPPENLDAVVFDTDSRTLRPGLAARYAAAAGREARDADLVYKKFDSTLRGPLAAELSAVLQTTGRGRGIVAPAFPAAGRTTADGVQLVHGVPVHETEMRHSQRTPVKEGHVPTLLAGASSSVGVLGVADLEDPEKVGREISRREWTVVDARRDADLEALVRAVPDPGSFLWAGSAGLALALGEVYPGPRAAPTEPPTPARAVLVVVGSLNAASRTQLDNLVGRYGKVAVPVGPGSAGSVEKIAAAARSAFSAGPCVVVHSSGKASRGKSGEVMRSLAGAASVLGGEALFDGLVLTGGSTAVAVSRALGASGIRLRGEEVETGVPAGTLVGPAPYPVVTKAGGFGGPDTLVDAVEFLLKGGT